MKIKYILLVLPILFWFGCEDKKDDDSGDAATFTEGIYTISTVTVYEGEECSGNGVSGMCTTDESVTTKADCPVGQCMDGESGEDTCPDGMWFTGMCLDDNGEGLGDLDTWASAEACGTAEGNWLLFGWNPLATIFGATMGNSATFGADGVFISPDGYTGTYTLVDNVLTITDTECYDESMDDSNDDYTTEADCTDAGLEWSVSTTPGTFNEDGTITIEMHGDAECNDDSYETQAECEAANADWEDAECIASVWTLSN